MRNTLVMNILIGIFVLVNLSLLNANKLLSPTDHNSAMCSSVPTMQCPSYAWLKPNGNSDPSRTGMPTVQPGSSDCLEPIVTYTDDIEIINVCHRLITRTWIATDPEDPSLFTTCVQLIRLIDELNPIIENVPEDIIRYSMDSRCQQSVSWEIPAIYDNYEVDYINITGTRNGVEFPVQNGGLFEEGITEVTYTVVDFCGLVTEASFEINIMCATCFIECPENVCLPVGSNVSPDSIGYATNYSGNVNCGSADFEYRDLMLETGCNGVSTSLRIWSAVFETMPNMEFTCSQRIELKNENELTIANCPEDVNVPNSYTPVYWEDPITITSDNSNITYLSSNFNSGDYFPLGSTVVTFTATDLCDNESTCSFRVNVLNDDSYEPCPDDIVTSCDGNGTANVDWEVPVYEGDCTECPKGKLISGFMYMGTFNGSNYYCSRHHYNYEQAHKKVQQHGGYLASINSREENEYLASNIASRTALIGLSDVDSEGNFVWDSGEDVTFEDWFTAQPNDANYNQDAVELLRSGEWNDIEADAKREFIMEIPCEFVTQIEGPTVGEELDPGEYYVLYKIADGCGFEKYCGFNILVSSGITMSCPENIYKEISFYDDEVDISWEDLEYSSCCSSCTNSNNCIELTQMLGTPSGSAFERESSTSIMFIAEDNCGNTKQCYFEIEIGTLPGSQIYYVEDAEYSDGIKPTPLSDSKIYNIDHNLIDDKIVTSTVLQLKHEEAEFDSKFDSTRKRVQVNKESKQQSEILYPNPTQNYATLEIPNYKHVSNISVFNLNGQLMFEKKTSFNFTEKLNMLSCPNGIYFVKINYGSQSSTTMRLTVF